MCKSVPIEGGVALSCGVLGRGARSAGMAPAAVSLVVLERSRPDAVTSHRRILHAVGIASNQGQDAVVGSHQETPNRT